MNRKLRRDRNAFLLFLALVPLLLLAALPVTTAALQGSSRFAPVAAGGSAARSPYPLFEQLDRNRDGYLTRTEAAPLPALSERFASGDSNGDGKLDKVEYARALANLDRERAQP